MLESLYLRPVHTVIQAEAAREPVEATREPK